MPASLEETLLAVEHLAEVAEGETPQMAATLRKMVELIRLQNTMLANLQTIIALYKMELGSLKKGKRDESGNGS